MLARGEYRGRVETALGRAPVSALPGPRQFGKTTLAQTYLVRQLQPWFENLGKRQVKSPKIYLRDSGTFIAELAVKFILARS